MESRCDEGNWRAGDSLDLLNKPDGVGLKLLEATCVAI